jgi:signal transduction histidine kinase
MAFPFISLRLKFLLVICCTNFIFFGVLSLYWIAHSKLNTSPYVLQTEKLLSSFAILFPPLLQHSTVFQEPIPLLEAQGIFEHWGLFDAQHLLRQRSFAFPQKCADFLKQHPPLPSSPKPQFYPAFKCMIVPLYFQNHYQGCFAVQIPSLPLFESLKTLTFLVLFHTALLVFGFYLLFNRFILRPLDQLVSVCIAIQRGQYQSPPYSTSNEIGIVLQTLHQLFQKTIHSQKELEGKYQLATQRIKKSEQHLIFAQRLASTGKLVAGIAHEINNPLGGLLNAIHRLKKKETLPHQREYFDLLEEGLKRIQEVVQQVLQFSPRKTEPVLVDLSDILKRSSQFLKHRFQEKQMEILWELPSVFPPILGTAQELQQVFQNLFLNAMDASEQGSVLTIRAFLETPNTLCIEVQDQGCGMDSACLAQAFDLFYTTKEVGKGSGIGLSVVLSIIENHGGTLKIESAVQQGTKISLYFPLAASD